MVSESDARGTIRDWLVKNDIIPREEYQTGGGPADMYLGGYRVIIEVKRKDRLYSGPHMPNTGSQYGETAFEQVSRLVDGDQNREQTRLDEDRDAGWVGCVTDAERWWVWTYPTDGGKPQRFLNFNGIIPDEHEKHTLLERFQHGTQWAPPNPFFLFKGTLGDLKHLYQQRRGARETRIQKQLWLEQLRASGNPPNTETTDELFVQHTLLILVSRLVGGMDTTATGFVQWVPDGPILKQLREIVHRYDWRNEVGDILRSLYMEMINKRSRIIFGEFYTPDWLAEKICMETIDDVFIQEQLDNFNKGEPVHGVLDPACGSGTFLYHAARRILHSNPVVSSYLNDTRRQEFTIRMINGQDIHPVAVEMSRANMGRIFPGVSSDDIHIHQGDSLLISRPDTGLHALAAEALAIFTPEDRQFLIPNGFLSDTEGIRTFVMSARDNRPMPAGLGHTLTVDEQSTLQESHDTLRNIIRHEGDGVWAWYIQNQASAILLRRNKVGRIVSNPPWVRFNKIQNRTRKAEMERMSHDLGLWVGGNVATSSDISQLFVVRCIDLYLQKGGWSSWVLPHGALYGDSWRAFRDKTSGLVTGRWHMGRLPFPNTPTCVLWFGPKQRDGKLVKKQRRQLDPSSSWETVHSMTKLQTLHTFPEEPSEWLDGKKPLARAGATLVPHCFVKIDKITPEYKITTHRSMHPPWKKLDTFTGVVPWEWIRECLFFTNLMPFHIPDATPCLLPIVNGDWDPDRKNNDLYRLVYDTYRTHRGSGKNTPLTLESRYNHQNSLFAQFERTGPQVLYNTAGDNLYAARMDVFRLIDVGLFSVQCKSDDEALFLTAILNAPALLEAFRAARQSDRHFVGHIWRKIPIPRYNHTNRTHHTLVKLAKKAERIAADAYDPNTTRKRNRSHIKAELVLQGISGRIDDVVRGLFPNHT